MFSSTFSSLARRTVSRAFLSTAAKTRPFKILGVQQIAIGCAEKGPLNALWKDIFGFEAYANKRMEGENVDEDILKLGPAPFDVEVDLMTPIDVDGSPKVRACGSIYIFEGYTWESIFFFSHFFPLV